MSVAPPFSGGRRLLSLSTGLHMKNVLQDRILPSFEKKTPGCPCQSLLHIDGPESGKVLPEGKKVRRRPAPYLLRK